MKKDWYERGRNTALLQAGQSMSDPMLARKVKECFESSFRDAFPSDDVARLKGVDPGSWDSLHGNLDCYFANIAGYAHRADRLGRRSRSELVQAKEYLSQPFFEKHKSLEAYRPAITPAFTPNLFRDLETAERLRQDLLVIINDILDRSSDPRDRT